MKKSLFVLLLLTVSIGGWGQELQDIYSYISDEKIEFHTDLPIIRKIQGGTVFNITYEGDWTTEMKGAFEYACHIWEENLPSMLPLNIVAKVENIRSPGGNVVLSKVRSTADVLPDHDFIISATHSSRVKCILMEFFHGIGVDNEYINTIKDSTYFDYPDITITYNKAILNQMSYSLNSNPTDKYDFVTVVLRDIAKGLGFNTDCIAYNNTLRFTNKFPTYFENKVARVLGTNDSEQAYTLATQGEVELPYRSNIYVPLKLYAPNIWDPTLSLKTFIPDSIHKITQLLSYDFGRGAVIRDIVDSDNVGIFQSYLGWRCWGTSSIGGGGGALISGSTENMIPFGDASISIETEEQNLALFSNEGGVRQQSPPLIEPIDSMPEIEPGQGIGYWEEYMWPYNYAYAPNRNINDSYDRLGWTISILKKNGKWDVVYTYPVSWVTSCNFNTKDFVYHEPIENYARTCDGYLRCRITHCHFSNYIDGEPLSYRVFYYVIDCLPQKVEMGYSGLDDLITSRSVIDEYFRDVKIGIKNLEGTERVVVEQLNEGDRVPSRFEVPDFKEGYFVATVDKELYTEFTIIAYNKNGSTRSEIFELEPLEPWEGEAVVDISDDRITITNDNPRSISARNLMSYDVTPINQYSTRSAIKGEFQNNSASIFIGDLTPGIYVLNYYTVKGQKHSVKFTKR